MRRREFISLLGGAVIWPGVARAQQREQMRRIGILLPGTADDPVFQARLAAFYQELALLGWSIGRNVRLLVFAATHRPESLYELLYLTGDREAMFFDFCLR